MRLRGCNIDNRTASEKMHGPLAQLVEHLTFNQGVAGSIPAWLTIYQASSMEAFFIWCFDHNPFDFYF
ncbi:hypothetical protein SSCH_150020 [Syntrophaceticus schinkii]|uniref:Uncharacterized protein n=1 Tax=Syntrophaceticus schinkii TaxID=499207 RepID=A0A0B7MJJ9_9FIRM|nr:hypothetical protein SSCH_150020 [Syntrophaceticus schinkii]